MPYLRIFDEKGNVVNEITLSTQMITIGTSAQCDLKLKGGAIEKEHAYLYASGNGHIIASVTNQNNLQINGKKQATYKLSSGDKIQFPGYVLLYSTGELFTHLKDSSAEQEDSVYQQIYEFNRKLSMLPHLDSFSQGFWI